MAGSGGWLLWLWTEWGIQILVLVSMFLQVVLLIFGEMRRRGLSAWQSVVLWLAYQLADSTAIFTLGHLSITSKPREHGWLAAFWAPFLLLHLGGPHNITAYALEDNRLWLRHLQTLGVQAVGAAYVLYKFYHAGSGNGGTLLTLASVSMFVTGLAKYGERTWALRCANKTCRSSDRIEEDNVVELTLRDVRGGQRRRGSTEADRGDGSILDTARALLPTCRRFLFDDANKKRVLESLRGVWVTQEEIFKLVEMELSLMYDTLYTKAPVIHTWYGFCIHFISMVGTLASLCLFHLSRGTNNNQGQGYNRVDVVISYVLLAGAFVLEIISACRAVLSTWTCAFLGLGYRGRARRANACLRWLRLHVLDPLRKHLKLASRRLWRGTIGQYNLLHLATRDRTNLGSRLAAKLGLQDSWDKLHFSGTFADTQSLSMEQLKGLLKGVLLRNSFAYRVDPRGRFTLEQNGAFDSFAQWAVKDVMFDESIVIWHIATNIFIWEYSTAHNYNIELVEATKVLSNYMMFLLVRKPNMLPGRERRYVHLNASRELKEFLQDDHVRASSGSWWNNCCVLKKLFHHEGLDCFSRISEELAEALRRGWTDNELTLQAESDGKLEAFLRRSSLACAAGLATQLLDHPRNRLKTLEVIFEVWVEMMLYAAENCPRDSHARELGNGGELMTIVWLLVKHYNQAARSNGSNSPAESGGEVGRKLVHFDGPLEFTADDLLEIMRKSTYMMVYHATLEDGSLVAVKRFREEITKVDNEFEAEAAVLGKIRHPNLLALRAYSLEPKGEKLLFFDDMPGSSLYGFLHVHARNTPVDWATRMIIAKGMARGLAYLHDDMSIIHGNMTARNVLLDEHNNPKLSEFGLSGLMTATGLVMNISEMVPSSRAMVYRAPELKKLVPEPWCTANSHHGAGGYRALVAAGALSKLKKGNAKMDVYSLGVIILELLTGKSPAYRINGLDLPQWVAFIVKEERTSEVFDLELMRDAAAGNVGDELMDTLKLALHCIDPSPSVRPDAREVLRQLEQIRPRAEGGAGPSQDWQMALLADEGHEALIDEHEAFRLAV